MADQVKYPASSLRWLGLLLWVPVWSLAQALLCAIGAAGKKKKKKKKRKKEKKKRKKKKKKRKKEEGNEKGVPGQLND